MPKIFNSPSKISGEFKRRILRDLLPPSEELVNYSESQLKLLAKKTDEIKHLLDVDPVRFFEPNPGGQFQFMTCLDTDPDAMVLLQLAGNKAGKTTGGAILVGERLTGRALWGRDFRKVEWKTPAVGMVFAEDFESHEEQILPNLLSWIPKREIKRVHRNNIGAPTQLDFTNGSVLRFKTFVQGHDTAEGKDWDIVWVDEPPSRSLYTAILRGLVTYGGKLLLTATLLKETWLYDEIDLPHVRAFFSTIHDNPHLSQAAIEAFLASLPEEEREVRESGKPMSLTGLIYRSFQDSVPYVIPCFELPTKVPYIIGVDPHERRPVHVMWGFITPQNETIWFDWLKIGGDTETLFRGLRDKERQMGLPAVPVICIMDPNRGKATQLNSLSWQSEFEKAGYDVVLGQDDINFGHTAVYNALKLNERTHRPKLMFMESCRGSGGPVYQMLRYSWDDWQRSSRVERAKKEKPKNVHKDFPDIVRYVEMENLDYHQLYQGPSVITTHAQNMRPYGRL